MLTLQKVASKYDKLSPKETGTETDFSNLSKISGWPHVFLLMGTLISAVISLIEVFNF